MQIKGLELKLQQVQKMLQTHEKLQEKTKEVRFVVHCSHPCCDCSNTNLYLNTITNLTAVPRSCGLSLTSQQPARSCRACCSSTQTWSQAVGKLLSCSVKFSF